MASNSTLISLTILVLCLLLAESNFAASARLVNKKPSLAARLKLDQQEQGSSTCWESLFQLQSCTSEFVMFFMNGETYLGQGCCDAIKVIHHDCWPSMLGSLGYTTQEGDILLGYCDANDSGDADEAPSHPSPKQVECVHKMN